MRKTANLRLLAGGYYIRVISPTVMEGYMTRPRPSEQERERGGRELSQLEKRGGGEGAELVFYLSRVAVIKYVANTAARYVPRCDVAVCC